MPQVIMKKLPSQEWERFKSLRIRGLNEEPIAFGLSLREAEGRGEEYWRRKIHDFIFAEEEGNLLGCAGVEYGKNEKLKHRAHIKAMYVVPEARGKGVGRLLFETLLAEIESRKEIVRIDLSVITTQTAAIELYKQFRFKIESTVEKNLLVGGVFYDGYEMCKIIR